MKRLFSGIILSLCLCFAFLAGHSVSAVTNTDKSIIENLKTAAKQPFGGAEPGSVSAGSFVGSIINVLFGFVGTIAFIFFLYGGFLWLTAGGNDDQVSQAKAYLRNATIGLIVIILAYTATVYITDLIFQATQQ